MMSILIKNITEIYTMDNENPVIDNGYIIIEENKIKEIGSLQSKPDLDNSNFNEVIDGSGKIALPGLINLHTHSSMTLLRGYADDMPLQSWLEDKIWPAEAKLTAEDIYWGSMLAIMEMIKTGTTTFTDMYFQMHKIGEAVNETGIRAVLGQGLIEANDGEKGLTEARKFCRNWNGAAEGRISTVLSPHAPYTCSDDYLKKIINSAVELNLPINIHVAETCQEVETIKQQYGKSPVGFLEEIGLFTVPTLAAHCVYVDKEDIEILAKRDVGVAYNPMSNMKLGSGIAPVCEMLNNGVLVGIGTDGVSSNNNLDLIEEARIGSYLQKVNQLDSTILDIYTCLDLLTVNGAKILNLNNLGLLKEGFLADVVLFDIKSAVNYYPHYNNLSNLFYAGNGRDVSTVVVNGKVLYNNNQLMTIDEEKVYYKIEERVHQLM